MKLKGRGPNSLTPFRRHRKPFHRVSLSTKHFIARYLIYNYLQNLAQSATHTVCRRRAACSRCTTRYEHSSRRSTPTYGSQPNSCFSRFILLPAPVCAKRYVRYAQTVRLPCADKQSRRAHLDGTSSLLAYAAREALPRCQDEHPTCEARSSFSEPFALFVGVFPLVSSYISTRCHAHLTPETHPRRNRYNNTIDDLCDARRRLAGMLETRRRTRGQRADATGYRPDLNLLPVVHWPPQYALSVLGAAPLRRAPATAVNRGTAIYVSSITDTLLPLFSLTLTQISHLRARSARARPAPSQAAHLLARREECPGVAYARRTAHGAQSMAHGARS